MITPCFTCMDYIHDLSHKDICQTYDVIYHLVWEMENEISKEDMHHLEMVLGLFEDMRDKLESSED